MCLSLWQNILPLFFVHSYSATLCEIPCHTFYLLSCFVYTPTSLSNAIQRSFYISLLLFAWVILSHISPTIVLILHQTVNQFSGEWKWGPNPQGVVIACWPDNKLRWTINSWAQSHIHHKSTWQGMNASLFVFRPRKLINDLRTNCKQRFARCFIVFVPRIAH